MFSRKAKTVLPKITLFAYCGFLSACAHGPAAPAPTATAAPSQSHPSVARSQGRANGATSPVPSSCDAAVNQGLATFLAQHQGGEAQMDNVMVCGTALLDSIAQQAGSSGAGAHHVIVLSAPVTGGTLVVQVVSNDTLDGVVSGKHGDPVFAFGQAFEDPRPSKIEGVTVLDGVHDVHCSTHRGAQDGYVIVAGQRYPKASCSGGS